MSLIWKGAAVRFVNNADLLFFLLNIIKRDLQLYFNIVHRIYSIFQYLHLMSFNT